MKKLELTSKLRALLQKVSEGLDPETVSVYEAIAINTLPVKKKGLFNGAMLTESTLSEMAAYVTSGNFVPMHILHDQSYGLPVGKVILAEKVEENGLPEVRILFYVGNTEKVGDVPLVDKLENSSIEEVSIGFQAKFMLCSECGWDYQSDEATMENFWNLTCANDHEIGVNGVHLNLSGLKGWYETSLVSLGAAQGAKIVGRSKSLLGETEYNRLAASGISPDARILFASATQIPPENPMDKELLAQLTAQSGELAVLKLAKDTHAAAVAEFNGKITVLEKAKTDLTADLEKARADLAALQGVDANVKLAATEKTLKEVKDAFFGLVEKFAIASGTDKPKADASPEQLIASLGASQAKLALFPVGGVSNPAGGGSKPTTNHSAANFQTE